MTTILSTAFWAYFKAESRFSRMPYEGIAPYVRPLQLVVYIIDSAGVDASKEQPKTRNSSLSDTDSDIQRGNQVVKV